ncbi:prepilin-type N-terminal cleavage/methylation domain-containing protein [Photobacterium phosphoreum]|uniref:type II secretion system protein n=1 Tax=Photobacterium phosphoreum TaxID=659 RepID=UPI001E35D95C|nr:prepilin-type N-terminal cleavage/methylation domain-containing protein [Photobacterium phosphoreum]MCD9504064.1 prepilin-type N-terminal cleavage/methylation domain-containing protein [Photobacterium phosphoreum]
MKKQQGFGLIEVILGLAIFGIVMTFILQGVNKYTQIKNAKDYAIHIERVITQLQQYQYYQVSTKHEDPATAKVWPSTLESIMSVDGQFWPQCSMASERNQLCQRPDSVPWTTQRLGYSVTTTNPTKAIITLPSPSAQWAAPLRKIPFAVTNPTTGDISITIGDPLLSQAYKDWLNKDGSTELTGTWDVGNQAILNAERISVRAENGKQLRIDAGTVKEFLAIHDQRVYKNSWSCPRGLKQTIHVSLNAPMAPQGFEYIGIANYKPFVIDRGPYYQLGLEYNAKIKATGKWEKMTSGYLNVRLNCTQ